jgi:hypothetical protein
MKKIIEAQLTWKSRLSNASDKGDSQPEKHDDSTSSIFYVITIDQRDENGNAKKCIRLDYE